MRELISRHAFELVAVAAAAAIVAHAQHLPTWLLIAAPLLIGLRIAMRRRGAPPAPLWIRLPAAMLLLVAVVLQFHTLFGREPGSVLGCGLLALKVLETERPRDARVAVGFAAFVLMSALLFQQTLWFTIAVSLALIVLLAALVALQPAPVETTRPLRSELTLGTLLLAFGLPLAAAGFLLIPRLATPLWGTRDQVSEGRTGLDDRMAPGTLTDLLTDDSPAFRVHFDGTLPPSQARYFRAIVLWDYDGTTWTRSHRADFLRPADAQRDGAPIDYTITIEPTDRRWLPALDLPIVAPAGARFSADRELIAEDPIAQPREYRVRSTSRYTLSPSLRARDRARALELPNGFDPRTHALAESWRSEGRDDAAIVRGALDLFHRSFTYTLNPPLLGHDATDDFLFDTRRGFCEHYASAFVVLMRAAGIPARVVTGYQGGWWNAEGDYLLVRNSDAHAWAEAWLAGRGWVRVDPTAAVSPARIELGAAAANDSAAWSQAAWVRALRNRFDVINRMWTQSVIRFDTLRQRGLLTPFGITDANQGDLLLALSITLGAILLVATVWAMRDATPPRSDDLDRAWTSLGRRLARAGVARQPSEGPLDLLSRARAALPAVTPALTGLVQDYVALRYGAMEPMPERVRVFARNVRNFRISRRIIPVSAAAGLQR